MINVILFNDITVIYMFRYLVLILSLLSVHTVSASDDYIRIVGSSTVFPFVAAASEQFSEGTSHKAPVVESIGTGAGLIEFCKGLGAGTADIANASRAIKSSERGICDGNGVTDITEIPLGMDGVIIAGSNKQASLPLTRNILFLALAKKVPVNGELVDNPYTRWKQIDASLPDQRIEVYGPKSTSGTRDAFVELVMEPVCISRDAFKAAYADAKNRALACHMMREDGHYIEAGENDNLIVQKLVLNNAALGIFGYSYLDQNSDRIMAHPVDGVMPSYDAIADTTYPVARSLFVYVKNAHIATKPGLKPFLEELTSEDAIGEYGYLVDKGLISYQEDKRQDTRDRISQL